MTKIKYILFGILFALCSGGMAYAQESTYVIELFQSESGDIPPECDISSKYDLYADESLSGICFCKETSEGVFAWCPIDGGDCGTATSCD